MSILVDIAPSKRASWGRFLLILAGPAVVAGCGSSSPTDTTPVVDSIVVTGIGSGAVDAIEGTRQFVAEAFLDDAVMNPAPTFTWSTSDTSVATVNQQGIATAVANGTVNIEATVGEVTGSRSMTVEQALASIQVSPDEATLIGYGASQELTAEGRDSNGYPLSDPPTFTWSSSDEDIATVDASEGTVTSEGRGTTSITATSGSINGSADLTVLGILHWTDSTPSDNAIPGALQQLELEASHLTGGAGAAFADSLATGGWALVIFGEESNHQFHGDVATALTDYVDAGGRVLGATWRAEFPELMEAERVDTNFDVLVTGSHAIYDGLPALVNLDGSGFNIYSQTYETTGDAECLGTTDLEDCAAVLGNGGRTLLTGPLFSVYANVEQGETFLAQSIAYLLADAAEAAATADAIGEVRSSGRQLRVRGAPPATDSNERNVVP